MEEIAACFLKTLAVHNAGCRAAKEAFKQCVMALQRFRTMLQPLPAATHAAAAAATAHAGLAKVVHPRTAHGKAPFTIRRGAALLSLPLGSLL